MRGGFFIHPFQMQRSAKHATDEGIHEQVGTVRARLGPLVHSIGGKAIRIAISTVVGIIPLVGTAIGAALSIVDSYLLERVFAVSGPTLFLSRQYPSLFEKRDRLLIG